MYLAKWLYDKIDTNKPFLVGGIPTHLKNMSSSVGIMKCPIYGKMKHVPNNQPDSQSWVVYDMELPTL